MVRKLLDKAKNILLLSIRPQYVSKLFDGTKSTELRRVKPRVLKGDVVLIYETSPTMALVGYAIVESVMIDSPCKLWNKIGNRSGITKLEYNEYYNGATVGYAINFQKVNSFCTPKSLPLIKSKIEGFHPPQSYRYLCANQASSLCLAT